MRQNIQKLKDHDAALREKTGTVVINVQDADNDSDEVFMCALNAFSKKMKRDMDELAAKGRDTMFDIIQIFTEILRLEMQRREKRVEENLLRSRVDRFRAEIMELPDQNQRLAQVRSHMRTPSASSFNMEPEKTESFILSKYDLCLAKVYDVRKREHMKIKAREEQINDAGVLGEELRLRLLQLENHPFYNKDNFVHKTASLLKWKKAEEQSIINMLRSLGQPVDNPDTLAATRTLSMSRSGSVNSHGSTNSLATNGDANEEHAEIVVGVLRGRNLTGKDETGKSDPYCRVKCKTTGVEFCTNVVSQNLNPVWNEACTFALKHGVDGKPLTFKITVWDKDEGKDDFLGQVVIENMKESDYNIPNPVEKWYKLQKRSKRSNISGDLQLRFEYTSVRAKREAEEKKRQDAVRAEQERKKAEAAAKAANLPNYHKIYDLLLNKLFEYELEKYKKTQHTDVLDVFVLPKWFRGLSEEFGARYGVGNLYRTLIEVQKFVEGFKTGQVDIFSMRFAMEEMQKTTKGDGVRWTRQEYEMCADALNTLETLFTSQVYYYKDFFPYSTPPGHLSAYIDALRLIYDNTIYRTNRQIPRTLEETLMSCVETCCHTIYQRYAAMSTPLSCNPTPRDVTHQISALVDWLVKEIDDDALYFRKDFVTPGASQPIIDLVTTSVTFYGRLLSKTVSDVMDTTFGRKFDPEVMTLYFRLKKFNTKAVALVADDQGTAFQGFKLTEMFATYMHGWLEVMKGKILGWTLATLEKDNLEPISPKELHSASVVDVFCSLAEVVAFLKKLEWDDQEQYNGFIAAFVEVMANTVKTYCGEVNRKARATLATVKSAPGEKFLPTQQMCVLFNNLEAAVLQTQNICESIGYPGIIKGIGLSAGSMDLSRSRSQPLVKAFTSSSEGLIFTDLEHTDRLMEITVVSACRELTGSVRPAMDTALCEIAGSKGVLDNMKSLWKKRFGGPTPELPIYSGSVVDHHLEPLINYIDDFMLQCTQYMYKAVFDRVLHAMWEECLYAIETILEGGSYSSDGLSNLEEATARLVKFFHAEGDGLPLDVLSSPRHRVLIDTIATLRAKDVERLITLHAFAQGNTRSQQFLTNVMKTLSDKRVQSYLSSFQR
eukprot:comp24127_c0_seq4/m.43785 comp24127_c0_seq4/g.43785  ORF comp24127_c0_seq4/g.43785 comp24127_c0_seq4/m.43785 type:complete len:1115 (-) comp24127_c0_seq4:659-4003(-)